MWNCGSSSTVCLHCPPMSSTYSVLSSAVAMGHATMVCCGLFTCVVVRPACPFIFPMYPSSCPTPMALSSNGLQSHCMALGVMDSSPAWQQNGFAKIQLSIHNHICWGVFYSVYICLLFGMPQKCITKEEKKYLIRQGNSSGFLFVGTQRFSFHKTGARHKFRFLHVGTKRFVFWHT